MPKENSKSGFRFPIFYVFLACVFLVLGALFIRSFLPGEVIFSNDSPLGALSASWLKIPSAFHGIWVDLNTIGFSGASLPVSLSYLAQWILGALYYSKFFVPLALAFLACSVWFCMRRLKLGIMACFVGALAACLNSAYFSAACWGVIPQVVAFGMDFIAVGLLAGTDRKNRWAVLILAGLAVGINVMEAADIGALFSLMIAAFTVYQALVEPNGSTAWKLSRGVGQTAIIAVFAGLMAAHTVFGLITTQVQGVAGSQQDNQSKAEHWDWATQWSLPKRETLQLISPGLFGYRMDTAEGGNYWGAVGRDPNWDRWFANGKQGPPPMGSMRFTGGGLYAGVPVVLIALWAALQAIRRKNSVFGLPERKFLWFWIGVVVVCLPLAWGRFAPFYQIIYHLPYFSTIRNPVKFMHLATFAILVLFAFGVDGLWRRYVQTAMPGPSGGMDRVKAWWGRASRFDRRWVYGCALVLGASLVGWLVFSSSREAFERYLQEVQFDENTARAIAGFSISQVGWFVLFFVLGAGLVLLIMSGVFAGRRAKWAGILLGLVVVADLGRADLPWIVYWNYPYKYATNPVIEILRKKPYEQRVAILPFRMPPQMEMFQQLYRIEWAQHHFLYYDIQSLDVIQMPRMPVDLLNFETALRADGETNIYKIARRWQLTNTRYLLGPAGFLESLNRDLDPEQHRFRIAEAFDLAPKPDVQQATKLEDITAVPKADGQYALFEFTGALPRVKLYSHWQVKTNDQAALAEITAKGFDPFKTVVVDNPLPNAAALATNQAAGKVEFTSYAPKDIVLKAESSAPSVLLLNDRYDSNWKVFVDGRREELLRCNYIMRGVYLPAGNHTVEFTFTLPTGTLWVNIGAVCLGIVLCGYLIVSRRKPDPDQTSAPPPQAATPAKVKA